jgi:hypothetical protein
MEGKKVLLVDIDPQADPGHCETIICEISLAFSPSSIVVNPCKAKSLAADFRLA